MNSLDVVLFALLIFGAVRGFLRGFFIEITSLFALVAGVYVAFYFSGFVARFLKEKVNWNEHTLYIVAFMATLVLAILVIGLAGKTLTKIANFAMLGLFNKLSGSFFGAFKFALLLSALLFVVEKVNLPIPFIEETALETSLLYSPIKTIVPLIFNNLAL